MAASVKLSLKAAREILHGSPDGVRSPWAMDELHAAIAKCGRASAVRKQLAKPKEAKRATKREETSAIRAAVAMRANERCEACSTSFTICIGSPEMDHFFGRGKAKQTVGNCWLLCRNCHWKKTTNKPDASWWLECFLHHANRHGYSHEAAEARKKLAKFEARGGQ